MFFNKFKQRCKMCGKIRVFNDDQKWSDWKDPDNFTLEEQRRSQTVRCSGCDQKLARKNGAP